MSSASPTYQATKSPCIDGDDGRRRKIESIIGSNLVELLEIDACSRKCFDVEVRWHPHLVDLPVAEEAVVNDKAMSRRRAAATTSMGPSQLDGIPSVSNIERPTV